jgi:hypothetical protein
MKYFGQILLNAALMKHAAFAGEREWRMVQLAFAFTRGIRFRTTGNVVCPPCVRCARLSRRR